MNSKTRLVSVCLLVLISILAACQAAPTPTPEPTATVAAPAAPTENIKPTETLAPQNTQPPPTEALVSANPYPGPTVEIVQYNPYPEPVKGDEIDWSEVPALVASGEITEVFQAYSLQITFTAQDGKQYYTQAPAKNEIFMLLDQCGEKCYSIRRISE
jgi:hypothetical protein